MKKISRWTFLFLIFGILRISAPAQTTIQVTSPNGGETWRPGQSYDIRWKSSNLVGTVHILLLKAKVQVLVIRSFESSSKGSQPGSYSWSIPSDLASSSQYRIKIACQTAKGIISDESNADFEIRQMTALAPPRPWVRLLDPNGGERILKTRSFRVRWTSNVDFGGANLHLKRGGDTLMTYTVLRADLLREGEWGWNWAVPNDIPNGDNYKLRVEGYGGMAVDESDSTFTITNQVIEVTRPRAGDVWYRTTAEGISFDCEGIRSNLTILAKGYPGDSIARGVRPSAGTVMWNEVGLIEPVVIPTGWHRIVVQTEDGSVKGESGRFEIRDPTVNVTSPVGGSRLEIHSTQTIRWNAPHLGGLINIVLYKSCSGGAWTRMNPFIATRVTNTGSYSWRVELTEDCRYKIRVEADNQRTVNGESGEFTIFIRL